MAIAALVFVNSGRLNLVSDGGQQWDEGAHYGVLVKNAHTPAVTDTTYAAITGNICDSTNYANQNIASKTLAEVSGVVTFDFADPDFTNAGADVQVARYLYIFAGTAGSPVSTDPCLGYVDLNDGGSTDVNIDAAIAINASGLMTLT